VVKAEHASEQQIGRRGARLSGSQADDDRRPLQFIEPIQASRDSAKHERPTVERSKVGHCVVGNFELP